MIELLLTITYVIIIGLSGGVITLWIGNIIGNPENKEVNTRAIFSFYGVWVHQKYHEYENRLADALTRKNLNLKQEERYLAKRINYFKMLGACPSCFSIWVTAIVSVVILYFTSVSLWWVFFALPFSSITLNYFSEYE